MSLKLSVKQRHENLIRELLSNIGTFEIFIDAPFCGSKLPLQKDEKHVDQFLKLIKCTIEKLESYRTKQIDFNAIHVIDRRVFGKVLALRFNEKGDIYAIKSLHKYDILKKIHAACFQEEQDVLFQAIKIVSPGITRFHYAFQDEFYLYFVMDFYNDGDMLMLFSKFNDRLRESITKFYIAEVVISIDVVVKSGYLRLVIKSDNLLLDSRGLIGLADLGWCMKWLPDCKTITDRDIGTPDYISSEIIRSFETSCPCDVEYYWWSRGIVIHEKHSSKVFLVDFSDFSLFIQTSFQIPIEYDVVLEKAEELNHLGLNDDTPYIPEVTSTEDTSNFEFVDFSSNDEDPSLSVTYKDCHLPCIGFTSTNEFIFNELGSEDSSNRLKSLLDNMTVLPILNGTLNNSNTDDLVEELDQRKMTCTQLQRIPFWTKILCFIWIILNCLLYPIYSKRIINETSCQDGRQLYATSLDLSIACATPVCGINCSVYFETPVCLNFDVTELLQKCPKMKMCLQTVNNSCQIRPKEYQNKWNISGHIGECFGVDPSKLPHIRLSAQKYLLPQIIMKDTNKTKSKKKEDHAINKSLYYLVIILPVFAILAWLMHKYNVFKWVTTICNVTGIRNRDPEVGDTDGGSSLTTNPLLELTPTHSTTPINESRVLLEHFFGTNERIGPQILLK